MIVVCIACRFLRFRQCVVSEENREGLVSTSSGCSGWRGWEADAPRYTGAHPRFLGLWFRAGFVHEPAADFFHEDGAVLAPVGGSGCVVRYAGQT